MRWPRAVLEGDAKFPFVRARDVGLSPHDTARKVAVQVPKGNVTVRVGPYVLGVNRRRLQKRLRDLVLLVEQHPDPGDSLFGTDRVA